MTLIIDGTPMPIPFTFSSIAALAKALGAPKVADLEKMLNKIGFDNCINLTVTLYKAGGEKVTSEQVEAAIEDPGYPIRLIEAIGAALTPDKGESEAVVKAISEGN